MRRALHREGLRFRVQFRPVPRMRRTADIAFPRYKLAVLIDGCFWHSCPIHGSRPTANREWWKAKLEANVERDAETRSLWEAGGWTVLRFWEHQTTESVVAEVKRTVAALRDEDARRAGSGELWRVSAE